MARKFLDDNGENSSMEVRKYKRVSEYYWYCPEPEIAQNQLPRTRVTVELAKYTTRLTKITLIAAKKQIKGIRALELPAMPYTA